MADSSLVPAIQAPDGKVSNLVNPSTSGPQITTTNIVCIVVFMIVVIVRLFTRIFLNGSFGSDDALIIVATMAFIAVMGIFQWMVSLGLGKHLWDVSLSSYSPGFLTAWVAASVMYALVMLTMKLSVLMLYRRLFPIQNFRFQWWLVFFITNAYSVCFIFASIFSCSPVPATWDSTISNARCINRTGLYIFYTVMNSLSTWWILLMPMPIVWSLALRNDKKTLLSALFALGCLPCVTSIARLVVLVRWLRGGHNDNDITSTLQPIVFWTQLELTVCMICACGPTLRTFVDRQLKTIRTLSSSTRSWSANTWSRSFSKTSTKIASDESSGSGGTSSSTHKDSPFYSNRSNLIEMLQSKNKTFVTGNGTRNESMEFIFGRDEEAGKSGEKKGGRREGIVVHTSYQVRSGSV